MALVKPSFSLQSGITLTNPSEIEYYSGPWLGTTLDNAIQAAKDNIPSSYRYHGMKIKLLVVQSNQPLPDPPFYNSVNALNFTSCNAYTYWFKSGIENVNLVPFTPEKDVGTLGTAAGSTGEIQFNKNGALSASSGLTFDSTKSALTSSYVVATKGLSGSLTKLADGTSYLIQGTGISISSGTNGGAVTISSTAVASPAGSNTQVQFNNNNAFGASPNLTFSNNALTSSTFVATSGITGSLTQISSGVPYLVALSSSVMAQTGGISISTGSNGQVSASYYVFPDNITVYLNGKTFGKYSDGDIIPAKGKTPAEVLKFSLFEPRKPGLVVGSPSTIVPFNTRYTNPQLTGSYITESFGDAGVTNQQLYWKRAGTQGGTNDVWTLLGNNASSPSPYKYDQPQIDNGSLTTFNTNPIYYRYDVTGSYGDKASSDLATITFAPYITPTISLTAARVNSYSQETDNSNRWRGNTSGSLSLQLNTNNTLLPMKYYVVQYSTDNATWKDFTSMSGSINPPNGSTSFTIGPITHSPTEANISGISTASNIYYRVRVEDQYNLTTGNQSQLYPTTGRPTLNFYDTIFYGEISDTDYGTNGALLNETKIKALAGKVFKSGSSQTLTFSSGNTNTKWIVAIPDIPNYGITSARDEKGSSIYFSLNNVINSLTNPYGTSVPYKIFVNATNLKYDPALNLIVNLGVV